MCVLLLSATTLGQSDIVQEKIAELESMKATEMSQFSTNDSEIEHINNTIRDINPEKLEKEINNAEKVSKKKRRVLTIQTKASPRIKNLNRKCARK